MRKFLFLLFTLLIFPVFEVCAYAASDQSLNINSKACILIDGQTGQVIYSENPDLRLYPASTTKIITAVLAIENGKMDQPITASRAAVNEIGINGSNAGIAADETMPLEDFLNAMLIKSANDCANVIAENISPTRNDFIDLMNKRAKELGATNTTFTNTCGLDKSDGHPNHMTTVSDMSKIARYAMTLPKFREIVSKTRYTMPDTNKHPSSYWPKDYIATTNRFLMGFNKYKNDNFTYTGIKTGYTNLAGCNLIASAKNKDGMELIAVNYGSKEQETVYQDTKRLFEYGFSMYGTKNLVNAGDIAQKITVSNAEDSEKDLDLQYDNGLKTVLPNDYDLTKVTKSITLRDKIEAPVSQGEIIGSVEFKKDDISLGKVNLVAAKSIAQKKTVASLIPTKGKGFNIYLRFISIITLLFCLFFGTRKYLIKVLKGKHYRKKLKHQD